MCLVSSGVVARRCIEPTIRDLLTIPDAVETMLFKFNWGNAMAAVTPFLVGQEQLAALGSRYVETNDLPWKPTPTPGIDMKIVDESGAELPWDGTASGDLHVRGLWTMSRYFQLEPPLPSSPSEHSGAEPPVNATHEDLQRSLLLYIFISLL